MTDTELEAQRIVNKYSLLAGGAGFLPIPALDIAGVAAFQVAMLRSLAKHYDQRLKDDWGKVTLSTVLGGAMPTWLGYGTVGYLAGKVPFVGGLLSFMSVPALASAATVALGKVFIVHFESGGTALDLDVPKMRAAFTEQLKTEKAA